MVSNFIHMAWISQLIWSFFLPTEGSGKKMKRCILTSSAGHCHSYAQHLPPAVRTGTWAVMGTPHPGRSPSEIRMLGGCPKRKRCQDGHRLFHSWAKEDTRNSYKSLSGLMTRLLLLSHNIWLILLHANFPIRWWPQKQALADVLFRWACQKFFLPTLLW